MLRKALLVAAVAAVAVPGTAAASRGVLVKVDRAGRLAAVAAPRGTVSLLHTTAATRLRVGERVSYSARRLRNGTFAATGVRVLGTARQTHVRGLVLAPRAGGYVLSAHGAVLVIRSAIRTTASATGGTPQVGTEVDVTADVSSGGSGLHQASVSSLGTAQTGVVDGRIQALAAGSIVIASDGLQVQLTVPAGLDLSTFAVGDEVLAYFSRQSDGSLLLTAVSANGDTAQASDPQQSQGNTARANQEVEQEDGGSTQPAAPGGTSATGGSGSADGSQAGGGSGAEHASGESQQSGGTPSSGTGDSPGDTQSGGAQQTGGSGDDSSTSSDSAGGDG